jgi:capsular exopolysaccharide synthesis family protein
VDLGDYGRLLRRRWRILALATMLGLAASLALALGSTPVYEAKTEAFVSLRQAGSDSLAAYQGSLFSQDRVRSYTQVVTSPAVTGPVVSQLKLTMTPDQLASKISVTAPANTVLIQIFVRDPSAERARAIAAAVGQQFGKAVSSLEAPNAATSSPVKVTLIRQPTLPTSPVAPRTGLLVAIGTLLGIAVGLGAAVIRDALDTSVKGASDLEKLTTAPLLGEIGFDRTASAEPLVTALDQRSARAEAFRSLRTNLRFLDVESPIKVVAVTSAVAEEGKSTTACNLAITLALAGVDVILVEGDLRRARVATYMGIEGAAGLTDVLLGRSPVDDVLQRWAGQRLRVLPSGQLPPNPSEMLGSARMHELLAELRDQADMVIVDAPPLLPVTDAAVLAPSCDGTLLVVRHGRTTRDQVGRALSSLTNVNARLLGTVMTMTPRGASGSYGYSRGYGYYSSNEDSTPMADLLQPAAEEKTETVPSRTSAASRKTGAGRS